MDERVDMGLSLRERIDLFLSLHLNEWINLDMIYEGAGCDDRVKMANHMYSLRSRYEYEDDIKEVPVRYENGDTYVKHVKWYRFTKRRASRVPVFRSVKEKEEYNAMRDEGGELRRRIKEGWSDGVGVSSIVRDRPERLPWTKERRERAQKQWLTLLKRARMDG